jgi:hypothetical protein
MKSIMSTLEDHLTEAGTVYEKSDDEIYVKAKQGAQFYDVRFGADEENRRIVLTCDLVEPIPPRKGRSIAKFIPAINDLINDDDLKIGVHEGHVRYEIKKTVGTEMLPPEMPSDMIDDVLFSADVCFPGFMEIFHGFADSRQAIEIVEDMMNE